MKTFSIQTLGCRVNQYESEQVATLLRARGLVQTAPDQAELRVVNTCSVTMSAASQSRQSVRRSVRLSSGEAAASSVEGRRRARVLVTGCWATSDATAASLIPGVDAVVGHHQNVAEEIDRLLRFWQGEEHSDGPHDAGDSATRDESPPASQKNDQLMNESEAKAGNITPSSKSNCAVSVNESGSPATAGVSLIPGPLMTSGRVPGRGATGLPLLGQRQSGRQRAFLKIQDGCDAHCTYCIIPKLRPVLWSKPQDDAVQEARRLVSAGHAELVLTGIFLGAYGRSSALRRRQAPEDSSPLAGLIDSLCRNVPGLKRVRLSSLEPGDLNEELISTLKAYPQVAPHFHLPLQSGSDEILRRMNRQYRRQGFLEMIDRVRAAFDRPAITTDVIVGFPGESRDDFAQTLDVVHRAGFVHVHAFPYSPRPGTAAARWTREYIHGPAAGERIEVLQQVARQNLLKFQRQFLDHVVEVIAEEEKPPRDVGPAAAGRRHGRCERYFSVCFEDRSVQAGDTVAVRITAVDERGAFGVTEDTPRSPQREHACPG